MYFSLSLIYQIIARFYPGLVKESLQHEWILMFKTSLFEILSSPLLWNVRGYDFTLPFCFYSSANILLRGWRHVFNVVFRFLCVFPRIHRLQPILSTFESQDDDTYDNEMNDNEDTVGPDPSEIAQPQNERRRGAPRRASMFALQSETQRLVRG